MPRFTDESFVGLRNGDVNIGGTVAEMIERLKAFDPDASVEYWNRYGEDVLQVGGLDAGYAAAVHAEKVADDVRKWRNRIAGTETNGCARKTDER